MGGYALVLLMWSAIAAPAQTQRPAAAPLPQPALDAYLELVERKNIVDPVERAFVVAALDRLASALEGVVFAYGASETAFLEQVHDLRRDIRQLYAAKSPKEIVTKQRKGLFLTASDLVAAANRIVPQAQRVPAARLQAVDRAARSLDLEDPLLQQPDNVERFLRNVAEAFKTMAGRAP